MKFPTIHLPSRGYFLVLSAFVALMLLVMNACTPTPTGENSLAVSISSPQPTLVEAKAPPTVRKGKSTALKNSFSWRNVNIQGMGYVTGLVIAPQTPYDVYVRTDIGGIYRYDTPSGGKYHHSWLPLMDMFNTNFSKGGVGVESIAVDESQPNRIYAAVTCHQEIFTDKDGKQKYKYSGEIMVSHNRGQSWQATGLGKHHVYIGANQLYRADTGERLAVDPNNSQIIYFASRRHGLWRKNGNSDWAQITGGLPPVTSLPEYKKSNGKDNEDIPGFTFITFDKRTGNSNKSTQNIYVGVHGSGVWQSQDAGKTWQNIQGADNPLRSAIANDGTLYVAFGTWGRDGKNTTGSLRRYQNGAWTEITPDGKGRVYSSVTVQLNQANTVMAVSDKFVYRSTNGGKTWQKQTMAMGAFDANHPQDTVNTSAPGYYQAYASTGAATIKINPSNPKQVWWTNGWGVARTDDVTAKTPVYKWMMNNLEELDSNMVRVPPKPKAQGGADLISAVQDKIGFRHINRNQVPTASISPKNIPINPAFKWANPDWKFYPQPFPHIAGATGIDYSYSHPDRMAFVGFHQWQGFWGIHGISNDNGKNWQAFASVPTEELWKKDKSGKEKVSAIAGQIAISPTNPQNMVWSPTWGTWTHYTTNGGKTWQLSRNLDHKPKPEPFDEKNNDHLHYNALPKSWGNSINPWVSSYILAADRKDSQGKTFYYFDGSAFYYSLDGGVNWRKSKAEKFPSWVLRPAIVPNPAQQGDVWMSFARNPEDVNGNPLYHSTDGGKTFKIVASVKSCEFVAFGKGKAANIPYIYIFGKVGNATKESIYKSEDMGKNWFPISDPNILQFPGITYMEGDMRTSNLLYVALTGRGIMVGERE
ncbi:exo-alpha-sialidase [Calothrix sp. UHCC 0171]|uniref:exo-alpha-sialidase n=1 Tax=Calothrix sp. UHCC 0171 TaxID=3110245 RepID=UPI002B203F0C|nr:exo-alpha-sialidase [Calothrix sp. UHCC 0171]MEA5571165.1 exo-alpha-sialidase [Calothrix sp. UHCC 0171]